ncbi:glutamamyl carboxypeptidase [Trypanosoma grayi]|uniref:glutamamyl carboxypeptidase n=1 Tax=Trypanosoma grayi TaxID=71804 RepID=UPI0004F42624|nr:glutamamyl carboxypeptidase [Trypanosoma grayi]KEG13346.1 glutamamyl carboxypeptidase [Trypanosoma grayi]
MTEKDGKLYGRGTCDMKGFVAVCMSLTPEFLAMKRAKPIHFAWSYDEEVGCLGGKVLTEFLHDNNIKADGCIVGEPTSNTVVIAHKGRGSWRIRVYGKAVHSSYALTDQGCNAIDYAAKLIVKIREIAEDVKFHGPVDRFFDVPFSTVSTNIIQGGNAVNTVPALCEFFYEVRNLPVVEAKSIHQRVQAFVDGELLPAMKREFPEGRIEIEELSYVSAFKDADEKDPFTVLLRRLAKDSAVRKVAYGTEAGQYQGLSMPVIVLGPGSILQAHQPNEFVTLEQLDGCANILRRVVQCDTSGAKPHL